MRLISKSLIAMTSIFALATSALAEERGGDVLPPPTPLFAGKIAPTTTGSRPAFPARPVAPRGAPNVLLVMTDDVGFGASSTFGGLIPTPNLSALAARGLKYNNFNTTAMCAPSRAALLTGRNSHAAAMGALSEFASGYPGYYGEIRPETATIAEILHQHGYNTAFFGKHNGANVSADSTAGPFDSWPTQLGFDYFYGFIGTATDQWRPTLFRGNVRVPAPTNGNPLDKVLADDLIDWVHDQKAAAPDKPFFIYLAPGTAHAPLQAPRDWIAKFKGRFDQGWDKAREEIFARQIKDGVVPAGSKLTPRPAIVPAWDTLTPGEQKVASRLMEIYAAQLAYQDDQFGRIVAELKRMGQLDNTLIIFVEGDNGASSEGGKFGTNDDTGHLVNQQPESDQWLASRMDNFGGPDSHAHYPIGWAWAMDTPFRYFKRYASHLGGVRNGMVLSWPTRVTHVGEIRPQFEHLVDVVPTILDAIGVPEPSMVNGVPQRRMDGLSMTSTFGSAAAPSRHRVQYFEQIGNRAIYQDGWFANTTPPEEALNVVNNGKGAPDPLSYKWELYDLNHDFTQSTDLAASQPAKLNALKDLWWKEAERNQVLPIDNNIDAARSEAEILARHPKQHSYVFWGPGTEQERGVAPPILSDSFVLKADIVVPPEGGSGVIASVGDEFAGWSFYLKDGKPVAFQAFSQQPQFQYAVRSDQRLMPGRQQISFRVTYAKDSRAADVAIVAGGKTLAQGTFANHINMADQGEGFTIGSDPGIPVTNDYRDGGRFNGAIQKVEIMFPDIGERSVADGS